jgi:hypothetical protein
MRSKYEEQPDPTKTAEETNDLRRRQMVARIVRAALGLSPCHPVRVTPTHGFFLRVNVLGDTTRPAEVMGLVQHTITASYYVEATPAGDIISSNPSLPEEHQ